ncbi:MAG TPA: hypothetical protein DHD79_05375 [Firmicutes bacterium]|jgi:hypothetical protein|nr:hypothetical protein [Bacillota bacterium]HAW72095.1 hypothetical protein [Bacillota bacterium]HAZ21832.1 hypothetical protein [Bacillota bacterium]HBE06780.1 hypothetical protein [Bacillota bacterium]HBG44351.1 hypothetical protein [Bacillota bacterium]
MSFPEKGTYVARRSYGCDEIFEVIGLEGNSVLLKGITARLMADAPISDLVGISRRQVQNARLQLDHLALQHVAAAARRSE